MLIDLSSPIVSSAVSSPRTRTPRALRSSPRPTAQAAQCGHAAPKEFPEKTKQLLRNAIKMNDAAIKHAFQWDQHMFDNMESEEIDAFLTSVDGKTWSTAFTGVDAPFAAFQDVLHEAEIHAPKDRNITRPRLVHMAEWERWEQTELKTLHSNTSPSPCLFSDVAGWYVDDIQQHIPAFKASPHKIVPSLLPIVKRGLAVKLDGCKCIMHNHTCNVPASQVHIAGFPCIGHSAMGARLQWEDESMLYILAWAGVRLAMQEPIIVLENVNGVSYLIGAIFSELYVVDDSAFLCPSQFGFAITRPREFYILRHRQKTGAVSSPLSRFALRFHRAAHRTYHQFFWLHRHSPSDPDLTFPDEMETDLSWARNRGTSRAQDEGRVGEATIHPSEIGDVPCYRELSAHELCLNTMERKHLNGYRNLHPSRIWNLQQNPDRRVVTSGIDGRMSCLIRAMWLQFTDANPSLGLPWARWLSGMEALACQGFRTRPSVKKGYLQSSFDLRIPGRRPQQLREGAGNSIAIPCIGTCLVHVFTNIELTRSVPSPPTSMSLLSGLLGQLAKL